MRNYNTNCDMQECISPTGEVRLLPNSNNPDHGNSIVCRHCFNLIILHRQQENKRLEESVKHLTPSWDSLKIYRGA
jgi:hypothetical protein